MAEIDIEKKLEELRRIKRQLEKELRRAKSKRKKSKCKDDDEEAYYWPGCWY